MKDNIFFWFLVFVSAFFFAGDSDTYASTMYGSTNYELYGFSAESASLLTINPVDASSSTIGRSVDDDDFGMSGIAFNSSGMLFASTYDLYGYGGSPSSLLRLDPDTADVLQDYGTIQCNGENLIITDLSFQPSTGTLFGISLADDQSVLYTIDTDTAAATSIGETDIWWAGGLAFSLDGDLYATDTWPRNDGSQDPIYEFFKLNPENGATLSREDILLEVPQTDGGRTFTSARFEGLGVRPEDGAIFASWDAYTDIYQQIDVNGEKKWRLIGYTNGDVADIDFRTEVVPIPAAVWLFGAGILGLVGVRRKQLKDRS